MANFEGYDRRIDKINAFLAGIGFECIDETRELCLEKGIDVAAIVRGIQPIAFDNAVWAYTLGAANAIKSGTDSRRGGGKDRRRASGLLRSRLRRRPAQSRPRPRQPRRNAAA